MAFNAINAAEFGGVTTAHLVSLNTKLHMVCLGNFRDDVINNLRAAGFNTDSVIFIEECSTQAPWHVARLCFMCQHANRNFELPFGGSHCLMLGDLTQLGPVRAGRSLTESVLDIFADPEVKRWLKKRSTKDRREASLIPNGNTSDNALYLHGQPYNMGARLMTQVRWFELNQQQRSIDPAHTALVNHTYHGKPLRVDQLRQTYQALSADDLTKREWVEASMLVATNRERYTFTHIRAVEFARHKGVVVVRWLREYRDWQQSPPEEFQAEAMRDPCFYEYFVPGADGFLTENIQRDLELVNATSIRLHSIRFDDDIQSMLNQYERESEPGEVITAPSPPICVMVEVIPGKNISDCTLRALESMSIGTINGGDDSKIILPLYRYSCRWDHSPTQVYGKYPYFLPSKVTLRRRFPFELAFAVTVHKAEGRTIHRIINALSYCRVDKCNFSYAQFHVAMTRVKESSHIRFLLAGNNEDERWQSIKYIEDLEPDPSIIFFFAGFRDIDDSRDPNVDWVNNAWSPERANRVFKQRLGIGSCR